MLDRKITRAGDAADAAPVQHARSCPVALLRGATELATPRMTKAHVEALDRAQERFTELTVALRDRSRGEGERIGLTSEWVAANQAFHDVIYEAADAPLVERIAKSARRTFLGQA